MFFRLSGVLRTSLVASAAVSLVSLSFAQAAPAVKADVSKSAAQLRLKQDAAFFVENSGQWNSKAKFLTRTPSLDVWVEKNGLFLDYFKNSEDSKGVTRQGHAIEMQFRGSNPSAHAVGVDKARLITQYLKGAKTAKDVKTAHSFKGVEIDSLYANIDLKLYNEAGKTRYDLVVAPGGNPNQIQMVFKGTKGLSVDRNGNLNIPTVLGGLQQQGLYAYQMLNGVKTQVPARFEIKGSNVVAYRVGAYDKSKQLVIDPIVYGSYYGGDDGIDEVRAVVADTDGGVFMTGNTTSTDFPVTSGAYNVNITGASDAFLTQFQGDAYSHDYAAYIGGAGRDTGKFIGLSPDGNSIWIAGTTSSADFPLAASSPLQAALVGASDIFLIQFVKDATLGLKASYSTYFGSSSGAAGEELKGFGIGHVSGNLYVAGETKATGMPNALNAYPGASQNAYVSKLNSSGTAVSWSRYAGGAAPQIVGFGGVFVQSLTHATSDTTTKETGNALAVDQDENATVVGTVVFVGNQNTGSGGTGYPTTAGVFTGGRLLRNNDIFVQKIKADGTVFYSALVGGADNDSGSGVAADNSGNVYIAGFAGSFDYPRTRGTFGQDFSTGRSVVTKLNADGSQIVYSTSLGTTNRAFPTGIAVDQRGFAFITGVVDDKVQMPFPTPADPQTVSAATTNPATIPTTADALRAAYTYPGPQDMSATDAWLIVLDNTAANEVYGTYIGGELNDYAFAPYTDRFGDVWVVGFIDTHRAYQRVSSTGTVTQFDVTASFGPGFITPLAFKAAGGTAPLTAITSHYGDYAENWPPPGSAPLTLGMNYGRDGYVLRFRIDTPIVQSLTLNPATIAGGRGATSTGTITLNTPATGSGVDVVVTLNNQNAASFDPSQPQNQIVVNIPAGATTGTFTVYSETVFDPTQVDIKAEYLGNFQIARLTVVPWLDKLTITPTTVVGGNNVTGVVQLFQPAPTGGIDIDLSTNNGSLISFPNGTTVNVPEGQLTAAFPIATNGVAAQTDVTITASLDGIGRTQTLTLKPASLRNITFSPGRVAGGTVVNGTLFLDGKAGSTFTVNLTLDAGTPGYSLNPTVLTFNPGDSSKTFTVQTAPEPVNTQRKVTATRTDIPQSVQATLFIDANFLTSFTLAPTTIPSNGTSTGTLTISNAAQAGGVVVNITSSDTTVATVPATVTIPAGQTTVTFPITGQTVATDRTVTITASRGTASIARTLTVKGTTFSLSANPTSTIGGSTPYPRITVTLPNNAPAGGVTVNLTSSDPAALQVPASVTVPAGTKTFSFDATTSVVPSTRNVTVTGTTQPGTTATVVIQVKAVALLDMTFSSQSGTNIVKGGQNGVLQVYLDAPAPAGGATITFTSSNPSVISVSAQTIPAGSTTTGPFTVHANRVNRNLAVTLTATYNGRTISRTITVLR